MSICNWIQKMIFATYKEWHMKSPIYDRNGFHIVGIDNSLKAMHDGYITYTELIPSYTVKGCTLMKAIVGKSKDRVDLYLTIKGKKYVISDLSYGDVLKIMRAFVRKEVLPDEKTYTEVIGNDNEIVKSAFEELSKLLLADSKTTQKFLKKHKHESMEDMDHVWEELCEELLRKEKAIELDWKERKDEFIFAVNKLSAKLNLDVDEKILSDKEDIPRWGKAINVQWDGYVLSEMDMESDSYVLLILSEENFVRAKKLAKVTLHRIAAIEEM